MSNPAKIPRHVRARALMREYHELTSTTVPYPRTNIRLAELTERVEVLRRRRLVHDELRQPGYTTTEAFSGADRYVRFTPGRSRNRFVVSDLIGIVTGTLPGFLQRHPTLKVSAQYNIDMYLATNPAVTQTTNISSRTVIVTRGTDLTAIAKDFFARIARSVEQFTSSGSGWVINQVNFIQLSVHEFRPATGSCYQKLPDVIIATRSCINVKNNDNKCALWSLLAALYPRRQNPDRISHYKKYETVIDMTGITFPVPISMMPRIERQNPNLFPGGINVFSFDETMNVYPWLISSRAKSANPVNLLWWNNHYALIKDLSRLMSSKMSGYKGKMYYCYTCLSGFTTDAKLIEHSKYCTESGSVATPCRGNNILKFHNIEKTKKLPFVIVGDLESFIVPVTHKSAVAQHVPASYRCNTICVNDKYSKLSPIYHNRTRSGNSPVVHMLQYLFCEVDRIESLLTTRQEQFTALDSYKYAMTCQRCDRPFTETNPKVAFYNAVSEKYIGAVHERCRSFQKYYPVVFHNLRGYDSHFIISALGDPEISQWCTDNNISLSCIPNNTERLMSITVGKLRFIDSYQFMPVSLDKLAQSNTGSASTSHGNVNISHGNTSISDASVGNVNISTWNITRQYFDESELEFVTAKGIFPYQWFDGPARFDEQSLPPRECFYDSIADSTITEEQYQRATTVWNKFSCKTFRDYHDLYLTVDVLLLADIFTGFRNTAMEYYGLDPAQYYSTPGLAWDAALKMTQVELELFTDLNMYLFIEKAIRGGISVITKKYSRANNKYLHAYDKDTPVKYIIYLDANNLYGAAMCRPMPVGGFVWISPEEFLAATSDWGPDKNIADVKFKPVGDDDLVSYFVEVDVDYPDRLHDDHDDYPYLASSTVITDDMPSQEQLSLRTTKYTALSKLTPTLLPRRNHICCYHALVQALQAGLVLRKIHKVLKFNQRCWLRPYITSNTTRRAAAKTNSEKDFFKMMNNAVFGKTMENIRRRVDVELVNKKSRRDKITRNSKFVSSKRITDNLSLITKRQTRLYLDKPIYVGAAVLDISKTIMYDFHYGFVKSKWPQAQLLFTDTDSLVYEISGDDCGDDLYRDIYNHRTLFDLSDVDPNGLQGEFHDDTNKKVMGKFKDEFSFSPVREFVGLRSKMYALITDTGSETKRAKGINSQHMKNKMKFDDYLTALARTPSVDLTKITTYGFRSRHHNVYTDLITKSGLSNYDDKRYCVDGINTFAIGNYRYRKK